MAEYVVRWEMDIDADSPREAAEKAQAWLDRGPLIGWSFDVGLRPVGQDGRTLPRHLINEWVEVDFEWIYWEENGMLDDLGNPLR